MLVGTFSAFMFTWAVRKTQQYRVVISLCKYWDICRSLWGCSRIFTVGNCVLFESGVDMGNCCDGRMCWVLCYPTDRTLHNILVIVNVPSGPRLGNWLLIRRQPNSWFHIRHDLDINTGQNKQMESLSNVWSPYWLPSRRIPDKP